MPFCIHHPPQQRLAHLGRLPTAQEGLALLEAPPANPREATLWRGPYLDDKLPRDPIATLEAYERQLRRMAGLDDGYTGEARLTPGFTVGYLSQEPQLDPAKDVKGNVFDGVRPIQDLIDRMLFIEAIETQKCFDENVLITTADANIGSIMGIGFPAWTGGVHQFIVGYEGGTAGFVARAKELAAQYGPRFTPPASLGA